MEPSFLSHSDAAQRNRNSILHFIKRSQPLSRTDIWEGMPISRASVTQVTRQLEESGLVREVGVGDSTGGRKPRYLTFNGAAKKILRLRLDVAAAVSAGPGRAHSLRKAHPV